MLLSLVLAWTPGVNTIRVRCRPCSRHGRLQETAPSVSSHGDRQTTPLLPRASTMVTRAASALTATGRFASIDGGTWATMANAPDKPVGRRRFLSKAAAGAAGLVATPRMGSAKPEDLLAHEQDQGHQNPPSDVA